MGQCAQIVNASFGKNALKIYRLVKWRGVLENVIPKTIDKPVFMGYNVDIFLFYSKRE